MKLDISNILLNKIITKGDVFMGRKVIDRTGEEALNNFGSKMIVKEYRSAKDIDVYFPEYNWTSKCAQYSQFKNGEIKCPYESRVFGKGYLGEGEYKVSENGKLKKEYIIWRDMLRRCYDPKYYENKPIYKRCKVEEYLLNFQHMGKWIDENYYEVPGEEMCLDKDILCKGNKVYSRDTCIFVPERINLLFVKRDNARGDYPIGVRLTPSGNYQALCDNGYGKQICLGTYSTKEEAFRVYKQYKENLIKETIDSYKGKIPEPYYSRLKTAMYNYEVEIDD